MKTYLKDNLDCVQEGYEAENVESHVFRSYGRVIEGQFGIDGSRHEKLLDWGCGSGAALRFFKSKGFDVYGVDVSRPDIDLARTRMPDIQDHLQLCDPAPKADAIYFPALGRECFDVVIAIQSLYNLDDQDLATCLKCIHSQMKKGGVIYASMMGTKCWYYNHSTPRENGLRNVSFQTPRLTVTGYHVRFIADEQELIKSFGLFRKEHVGYYDAKWLESEGSEFHWTFIGRKE